MPRSPSTVRVTRVVATTSRLSPESSGSSSTTLWTSVVAPPTSTTTVSPAASARSSTPVRTTSGVAPCTMARKSSRALRCLPPITWERNSSRIAVRAPSGARTPIRGTMLASHDERVGGEDPGDLVARLDHAGDHHRAGPARGERAGARQDRLRVAAVGATGQEDDVGLAVSDAAQVVLPAGGEHGHHLAAAGEGHPAPRLGGDQLLVADHGDPQAAARARAGQGRRVHCACILPGQRGQARVVPVEDVGVDRRAVLGGRDDPAVGQVDERGLGERRAEVDADDQVSVPLDHRGPVRREHGRGRRSGRRRSRCRR